ncbi:MAG: hypothetical protein AAGE98_18975 [Actinomycetota bacterium]
MRWAIVMVVLGLSSAACADPTDSMVVLEPGDPIWIPTERTVVGMEALGTFDLRFDPELNCLYHDEPSNNGEPGTGGRIVVIWPDGYRAERTPDGAAIVGADGIAVATTNSPFQLAGGAVEPPDGHCDAIGAWLANGGPLRN